jgi:hypothetical protein
VSAPTVQQALALPEAPRTRGDCLTSPRPCPWCECRHHLPAGRCVLDVVDAHPDGITLEDIGGLMGFTRQRAEQIQARAVRRVAVLARLGRLAPGPQP